MRVAKTLASGTGALLLFLSTQALALPPLPPHVAVNTMAGAKSRSVQLADLFGESDEEKAARQQHEDGQDAAIKSLTQRVHDLEETLQQITGQNEQLAHRVQELSDRLDRQQKDFEYRLCAMAAQQLGATPGSGGADQIPCNGTAVSGPPASAASSMSQAPAATASLPPPADGVQLGKPPGVLGTLPANTPVPEAQPQTSTQPQFDAAMDLLAKAQYDEARAAFRGFADANPKDPLAPQAVYWIGDIAYVQKDYPSAARAFAEEIKKYPSSPRGPDSMLKLGQSLIAMGQKKEGCTALAALSSRYPNASKTIALEAAGTHRSICR